MLKLYVLVSSLLLWGAPALAAAPAVAPAAVAKSTEEAALLAFDERQRNAVGSANIQEIAAIAHPNLRVNTPTNTILTKEDMLRMVASGAVHNDVFLRTPEAVVITGDVGVVMGREEVVSGPVSDQAKMFGTKLLNRRYTNVYLREGGVWRHLARHAHVVADAKPQ